jgi:hypothetical protein
MFAPIPPPQSQPERPTAPTSLFHVWIVLTLSFAGLVLLGLAATFVVTRINQPLLRYNATRLSVRDFEIALFPFIGGMICFVALILFSRHWKRQGAKSQELHKEHPKGR